MREAVQMQNFDTHESFKVFEGVGFKKQQAEAIVEVIKKSREQDFSRLATKEQLENVEQGLRQKLETVKQEIRTEIKDSTITTLKWMFGALIPVYGTMIAVLIKLFVN
jgi:coiled-coil family 90 protein